MVQSEITFRNAKLRVTLHSSVVEYLFRQRQRTIRCKERAGQLFGSIDGGDMLVVEATGPRRGERRTRTSYDIRRSSAQREIDVRYKKGLHFLGDWHTHSVRDPSPSFQDIDSMTKLYVTSRHELYAIVMLIVGTSDPKTWWCSVHRRSTVSHLRAEVQPRKAWVMQALLI